jgi:hypothetical protein
VILTKMMRIDPQDFADIRFLLQQERLDSAALQEAFQAANVPDITEIKEAFHHNQSAVLDAL